MPLHHQGPITDNTSSSGLVLFPGPGKVPVWSPWPLLLPPECLYIDESLFYLQFLTDPVPWSAGMPLVGIAAASTQAPG